MAAVTLGGQLRALGVVAGVVQTAFAQQLHHAVPAQAVELVDGAKSGQALARLGHAARVEQAVEQFAVRDADLGLSGIQPGAAQTLAGHGDDFGVGLGPVRADRVGVALPELAEAAGAGLFVAPDRPIGIGGRNGLGRVSHVWAANRARGAVWS